MNRRHLTIWIRRKIYGYSCKFFILILALIVWSFLHRDLVSQDDPVQIPTFKVATNNE